MPGSPRFALDRYLAGRFLVVFLVVLLVVVTLLQSLDLMNEGDAVLAAEGAGSAQLLRYIGWRAPQLADRFAPFVALMAALITFTRLSQSSEIIAMRAAGMSRMRVLAPLCLAGGVIALTHFAAHELVVVEGGARLEQWRAQDYAVGAPAQVQPIADIRLNDGRRVIRADSLSPQDDAWRLRNLRAYTLGESGLDSALRAAAAVHDGAVWQLEEALAFDTESRRWTPLTGAVWAEGPPPEQIIAVAMNPEQASLPQLARASSAARGLSGAARLETTLLHRFTAPAASLIMPLLAAVAGFGLHRTNTLVARIGAGLALGFAYFVFDNVMIVAGRLDAAPAAIAALAAPLLFLGIGLTLRK